MSGADASAVNKHIVILIHGIRTFGDWQERLRQLIKAQQGEVEVHVFRYGYFSAFAFILPFLRWLVIRRFQSHLQAVAGEDDGMRIDIVCHSFGTHVAAKALARAASDGRARVHTVILSGSVLPQSFPWYKLRTEGVVHRVVNDCGTRDVWPMVARFILGMGNAGRHGMTGVVSPDVDIVNRYFEFDHSGFFTSGRGLENENSFMERFWLPVLLEDRVPEGPELMPPKARWFTALESAANPIKIAVLIIPLVLLGIVFYFAFDKIVGAPARSRLVQSHNETEVERAKKLLAEANAALDVDPLEAYFLAHRSHIIRSEEPADEVMREAIVLMEEAHKTMQAYLREFGVHGWGSNRWMRSPRKGARSKDGTLAVFVDGFQLENLQTFNKKPLQDPYEGGPIVFLRFSSSQRYLLVGRQGYFCIYDRSGSLVAHTSEWRTKGQWLFLELLSDDSVVFSYDNGDEPNSVTLWKFDAAAKRLTFFAGTRPPGGPIISFEADPEARVILTLQKPGDVRLWRFAADAERPFILLHEFKVASSVASAMMTQGSDGHRIAVTFDDAPSKMWSLRGDEVRLLRTLNDRDGSYYSGFSADGLLFLTRGTRGWVRVWNTKTGKLVRRDPLPESAKDATP